MKTPIISLAFLVLYLLPLTLDAQEMNIQTARKHLEEIANADDFEDERLVENWGLLKKHSGELFPLWVDIVRTSDNDRLIQITMSTAGAAPPEKAKELSDLAITLLTERDVSKFPLAVESALKTMGSVGGADSRELIQQFKSHPDARIRLAAKKTLESLMNKNSPSALEAPAVEPPPEAQSPAPKKPTEQKPTPSTPVEEPPSSTSTRWPTVAVALVAALGLLWLLLKKRR